jgi:polysaccharide pyruvyl transferase WcaK-like protein
MSRVFVWATGQDDNLGDSALRRGYLDALRRRGKLTVWHGPASAGFITGLGLQSEDRRTGSYRLWFVRALSTTLRHRTYIAVNAGEVPVSRMGAVRMSTLIPLILLARIRGGGGVWLGAGVPDPLGDRRLALPYRVVAAVSGDVRVRDRTSHAVVGQRALMPDWAFALGTSVDGWPSLQERPLITLVLRGDRPQPTHEWLAWFGKLSAELGLTPAVVVQVGRDYRRAQDLSSTYAPEYLAWFVGDHAEHEKSVREVYRRSAVVVSDRLHALIFGATEGAVPIGWVESSTGKVGRHFDSWDMPWVGAHEGSSPATVPAFDLGELAELHEQLRASVTECRRQLESISATR